jgi:PAS domain S-box-containing protein
MKRPIRVLIVEDTPSDMELALRELRRAGFDPEWECVETEEAFLDSLQRDFDIILSDYSMPQFDGLRALALVKRSGLETPFILVSGTMGEETAVAAMKQGATDYLLKDRLARLGPAVTQALEQSRLRREKVYAEEALRESEERFRQLAENIQEVFWLTDPTKNVILYVSPAYETIWGRSRAGVYASGLSWLDSIHPEDKEAVHHAAVTKQAAGTYDEEYRIVRPDGSVRWIHDRAFPVRNGAGDIYRMVGVARDITERKLSVEAIRVSEQRFSSFMDNVPGFAWMKDAEGRYVYANKLFQSLLRGREWRGRTTAEVWPSEIAPTLSANDDRVMESKGPLQIVETVVQAGEERAVLSSKFPILNGNSEVAFVCGIGIDITEGRRAEQHVREQANIINLAHDAILVRDLQGQILFWNKGAERLYGWTALEVAGRNVTEILYREPDHFLSANAVLVKNGKWGGELQHRCKAGQDVTVEARWTLVRDEKGQPTSVLSINTDISERKQAEVVLMESERRFREMLENVELIAMTLDQKGRVTFCNDYLLRVTGWKREEVIGADWFSKFIPDQHRALRKNFVENIEAGEIPSHHENPIGTCSGQLREIAWNNTMLRDMAGKIVGTASIGEDVTERKHAEARVRESEERMRSILESALDCVITMDDQGNVVEFNPAAEKTFGYTRDEAIGQLLGDLIIPPALRERHRRGFKHYLATNKSSVLGKRVELTGMRRDNSEFPLELSITRMGSQEPPMFTGFIRDITERKQAENRLREQARLLDLAQDAIMVRNMEDRIEYWNHGAENLYGWNAVEIQGKQASTFLHEEPPATVLAARMAVTETGKWSGECRHLRKDGVAVMVRSRWTLVRDETGEPKAILTINTDITEQKRVEEQFLRAQRLESIGTLASGVAHDLNNILVPILMVAPLLRANLPQEEREKFLTIVESSAERGASIVKQVLTFARGADGDHVLLQPSYLISEIATIAERTFPKSINVRARYPENIRPLEADATQLHQVLLNLAINARDAMPYGGNLTLVVENFDVDDHYASMTPGAKPGPHVMMQVSDTGTGIPRHVIDKIFDPFFTTKDVGLGTGLGLSTVLGIVKSHGGFMHVYSEVGHTSFKVFLPAAPGHDCSFPPPLPADIPIGKGQTILVVDDEIAIREVAQAVLVKHGYKVLLAEDGPAALALLARHSGEVKVMLTDMVMPFVDGPTLVRTVRRMDPGIKVILSTGRDEDSRSADVAGLELDGCLTKPYTRGTLLLLLDHVLNPVALLPAA